jgi:hypothetical protein
MFAAIWQDKWHTIRALKPDARGKSGLSRLAATHSSLTTNIDKYIVPVSGFNADYRRTPSARISATAAGSKSLSPELVDEVALVELVAPEEPVPEPVSELDSPVGAGGGADVVVVAAGVVLAAFTAFGAVWFVVLEVCGDALAAAATLTVSVAAVVVALPTLLVKTARYVPACAAVALKL